MFLTIESVLRVQPALRTKRKLWRAVKTNRTDLVCFFLLLIVDERPGGGTSLYKVYRYVPPQRVWFLSRFGLKTGIDFDNYGLKSGRVFGEGNIYERLTNIFFFSVRNWND